MTTIIRMVLKWLVTIVAVSTFFSCRVEGSCLTFSRLSCTEGNKRGLSIQNRPETRLIPTMRFSCTGTLVGWTVSGKRGSGTMYPKLQIWRRSSTSSSTYYKNGPEIQIDAQGSACETIARSCDNDRTFHCKLSAANTVAVHSGSDIIGVELPPLHDQAFELLFISTGRTQYVWRREVTSSSLTIGTHDIRVGDDFLFSADVVDTDECLANTDGCDQVCTNTIGSFQCSCIDGYTLSSNGRSCLDIDECTTGTHNCQQYCININGGFLCGCNSGYQLNSDGRTCSDINECSSNSSTCCHQVCTNTIGSFQCSCIDGYALSSNGRSCLDIDECTTGTHNCQQRCTNINGGFLCGCNSGYQLNSDGRNCSDTDECLANTDGCHQVCTNTIGSFQCSCIDGYALSSNGRSCLDIDECTTGTHNCQQRCININGGFLCGCNSSYQFDSDGRTCSEIGSGSCLTMGAIVGGAVGTPLLVLVILLLTILMCVIKRHGNKPGSSDEIVMHSNEIYMQSKISDEVHKSSETGLYGSEEVNIYANVQ